MQPAEVRVKIMLLLNYRTPQKRKAKQININSTTIAIFSNNGCGKMIIIFSQSSLMRSGLWCRFIYQETCSEWFAQPSSSVVPIYFVITKKAPPTASFHHKRSPRNVTNMIICRKKNISAYQKKLPLTIWLFKIAMENGPFTDGLPIKNGDFPWPC